MKVLLTLALAAFVLIACTTHSDKLNKGQHEQALQLQHLMRASSDTTNKAPVLLLLHGYGSHERDLFAFANQIPDEWLIVSVRAPIKLAEDKYKWYDVKMVDQKITANMVDEKQSRESLLALIDDVLLNHGGDPNRVLVAGFSQGAVMSLNLLLTSPDEITAAASFSGRLMEDILPLITEEQKLASKQVFMSHGTEDSMLPMSYAETCKAKLESYGVSVALTSDAVGHTISEKQLTSFVNWIKHF